MKRITSVVSALALVLAACGAGETTETTMGEGMDDGMESMEMNMGDPDATRADEVADADLVEGIFVPIGDADGVEGNAYLARHDDGTTVTIELEGLEPGADYIAHVHADDCQEEGGPHYRFEIDGSDMPPNEIHLAFTADGDGSGFMTAENASVAGLEAVAVVVHPDTEEAPKLACADLS